MMELTIFEENGQLWTKSTEVAEMIGKDHKHLLRDIKGYIESLEKLGETKIGLSSFFQESTYVSEQNKVLPCYLISKKGCEFVGNKLTGDKGNQFTAIYVNRFNQYEQEHKQQKFPSNYLEALKAFVATVEEKQKLMLENAQQKQLIAEFNPKASYYDVVLQTKDVLSISKIAKDYGKSAQWLNEKLHELGVQYKQGKTWLLYQEYAERGYTKSKTHIYSGDDGEQHSTMHTYWTQKGRLFVYDLLKSQGIYPLVELQENVHTDHAS